MTFAWQLVGEESIDWKENSFYTRFTVHNISVIVLINRQNEISILVISFYQCAIFVCFQILKNPFGTY